MGCSMRWPNSAGEMIDRVRGDQGNDSLRQKMDTVRKGYRR